MSEGQKARGISADRGAPRVGDSPDIIRSSPKVLQFYEFWRSRCKAGGLPKKSDMDPVDMGPFLANIVLTEVSYEPLDFKYRIIGEELISRLGNLTGKRVREMALINVSSSAYQNYCAVVETKRPQFLEGDAVTALKKDRLYLMSRVHCPLSSDGQTVDFIISCLTFHGP
jgi:PAS domain